MIAKARLDLRPQAPRGQAESFAYRHQRGRPGSVQMHTAEFVVGRHDKLRGQQTNGATERNAGMADKRIEREREQVTDECLPGLSTDNDDHVRGEHT